MPARLVLALIVVLNFVPPQTARANDEEAAVDLVRNLLKAAREEPPSLPVLRMSFDAAAIARSILVARWTNASNKERKEFLDALRDTLADNVVRRFGGERSDLDILRSRTISSGDIIVFTRVKSETSGIVPVDWRVRRCEAKLCVVDLSVNGASVAIERREQYEGWLREHGGPITDLIPIMHPTSQSPQK